MLRLFDCLVSMIAPGFGLVTYGNWVWLLGGLLCGCGFYLVGADGFVLFDLLLVLCYACGICFWGCCSAYCVVVVTLVKVVNGCMICLVVFVLEIVDLLLGFDWYCCVLVVMVGWYAV